MCIGSWAWGLRLEARLSTTVLIVEEYMCVESLVWQLWWQTGRDIGADQLWVSVIKHLDQLWVSKFNVVALGFKNRQQLYAGLVQSGVLYSKWSKPKWIRKRTIQIGVKWSRAMSQWLENSSVWRDGSRIQSESTLEEGPTEASQTWSVQPRYRSACWTQSRLGSKRLYQRLQVCIGASAEDERQEPKDL